MKLPISVFIIAKNEADRIPLAILSVRDRGTVYFFSMATSFTAAALGAEGVGKDIQKAGETIENASKKKQ